MKTRKWILPVIAILIVAVFLLMKSKKSKEPVHTEVSPRYGSILHLVSANGVVTPRNRLEIKPPFSGRVEKILVREGENVKKGNILAWMSSTDRAALLDAARAKGADEVKKWEDVYKPTPIIAPLAGFIILRDVEPGQTVGAQDAILVMADNLIIQAQVDETDIGKLEPNQKATITLDAYPEKKLSGKIEHIAYESRVVSNITIYPVDILPDKTLDILRSGMSATVEVTIEESLNTLLLPMKSVRERKGKKYVTINTGSGGQEKREISTGINDGQNVEILSGIAETDTIIISPEKKRTSFKRRPRGLPGMSSKKK